MRVESARSTSKDHLTDSEQMELFRRGFDHFDSMNPKDQARVHVHLAAMYYSALSSYTEEPGDFFASLIRSPGFASWWSITKRTSRDDFVKHLDDVAASQQGTPLVPELMPWYRWGEADGPAEA